MDKKTILGKMKEIGICAVLRLRSYEECFKVMDALREGEVHVLEVTMSTPNALDVIRDARKRYGDETLVGVGTVIDAKTAEKAIRLGAQFVVGPSTIKEMIDVCKKHDIVCIPGTFTPTEILQAWNLGADLIKVFPASLGGPTYIKAIRGPLPQIPLVPTGGVNVKNAGEYIKAGAYCLAAGGDMVSKRAVAAGRFDMVTQTARDFLKAIKEARRTL